VADIHATLLEIEAEHQRNTPKKGSSNEGDRRGGGGESELAKVKGAVYDRWC
jgi:hypothetical protein